MGASQCPVIATKRAEPGRWEKGGGGSLEIIWTVVSILMNFRVSRFFHEIPKKLCVSVTISPKRKNFDVKTLAVISRMQPSLFFYSVSVSPLVNFSSKCSFYCSRRRRVNMVLQELQRVSRY